MMQDISTHTLRKEGDPDLPVMEWGPHMISTHTLRKEGDFRAAPFGAPLLVFQPTPSARRVTLHRYPPFLSQRISTHTLRKEGDQTVK